ncbi:MAG: hypothetical protein AAFN50_03400 [Pseudomonadota bacterium]
MRIFIVIGILVLPFSVHAVCEPTPATEEISCVACGNLEENPKRGVDLAFNRTLGDTNVAAELAETGFATVLISRLWRAYAR